MNPIMIFIIFFLIAVVAYIGYFIFYNKYDSCGLTGFGCYGDEFKRRWNQLTDFDISGLFTNPKKNVKK